jgi:aspartyl-tRNA(Asn)/glutamyl-tRNA(Gln) amidotransferase subunit B
LTSEYGLPAADAHLIAADRDLADLFEAAVAAGADAKPVANWIIGEVAPTSKVPTAEHLADLVKLVTSGGITRDQGREVLMESVESGRSPSEIVAEHGFAQLSDEDALMAEVEAVMEANPRAVEDYRAGKKQALGALMADLTKRAPQANRKIANDLLRRLLG